MTTGAGAMKLDGGAAGSWSGRGMGRRVARAVMRSRAAAGALRSVSMRGLVPSSVWMRLPVERTFEVKLPEGGSFTYASAYTDGIGRALYWRGLRAWESETAAVFLRLARGARVFLDVGANTGVYTLMALRANPRCRAVAFEPVPRIVQRLRENVRLNGLERRCEIRAEAVSDHAGTAKFHVPFGDVPSSSSLNVAGFRGYEGDLIEVPVTTLDELFPDETAIDLIKIDVEGFEHLALAGMADVLRRCRPSLVVECNPDGPYREVEALLKGLDYRFYHLRDEGPVVRESMVPDASERARNYLCRPREAPPMA